MYQVLKRDGKVSDFNLSKISNAITRAFDAVDRQYNSSIIDLLALKVTAEYEPKIKDGLIAVEDIQDSVEAVLTGLLRWKTFRTAWKRSLSRQVTRTWRRLTFSTVSREKSCAT